MSYIVYQVILVAEDGDYVLDEFNTVARAINYAESKESHYGDGQYLTIQPLKRGYDYDDFSQDRGEW